MAFRKCNKCGEVKSKELFGEGFLCTICTSTASSGLGQGRPPQIQSPSPSPYAGNFSPAASPKAGAQGPQAPTHPSPYGASAEKPRQAQPYANPPQQHFGGPAQQQYGNPTQHQEYGSPTRRQGAYGGTVQHGTPAQHQYGNPSQQQYAQQHQYGSPAKQPYVSPIQQPPVYGLPAGSPMNRAGPPPSPYGAQTVPRNVPFTSNYDGPLGAQTPAAPYLSPARVHPSPSVEAVSNQAGNGARDPVCYSPRSANQPVPQARWPMPGQTGAPAQFPGPNAQRATAGAKKESPKWHLPKATLQNEFKTAFLILESNFESVADGRPIGFHEIFSQQRSYTLKKTDPTFGLSLMCDACMQAESTLTGDIQLFSKVWLCDICATKEDIILKKRNNAAQHLLVQTKRCFDLADVDSSGGLDYMEYIHWTLQLSTIIPCVPQKPMLAFIWEIFNVYCIVAPDGKAEISWQGVEAFFEACFKIVPPNCEDLFYKHSHGSKVMPIWRFIRLLLSIFHPKSVYHQPEMRDKLARRPSQKPTFSFRQVPRAAKSFRGAIPKYDCSLLEKKRLLGRGGLCEAWLCNYKGNDVVSKIPLASATPSDVTKMLRAARQQMKFDHDNILRVLGVFEDATPPTILLELAEGGDVSDLLLGQVDSPTQWRLAKEIAEGLHCLHTHVPFPYAHRDLKGMNIFLTKDYHAKVADFDFLIEIPEGVLVSGMCGTPGYIAPEMLDGPGYDHRVDIWSYASLLYEITHGRNPYSKEVGGSKTAMSLNKWVPAVLEITLQGLRPQLELSCPRKMRDLITDCWKHNPDERPNIMQIIKRLDDMEADFDV